MPNDGYYRWYQFDRNLVPLHKTRHFDSLGEMNISLYLVQVLSTLYLVHNWLVKKIIMYIFKFFF